MVRKPGDVEKSLVKKGFERKEGDHSYFNYFMTFMALKYWQLAMVYFNATAEDMANRL